MLISCLILWIKIGEIGLKVPTKSNIYNICVNEIRKDMSGFDMINYVAFLIIF